jgi:hypothetical protein
MLQTYDWAASKLSCVAKKKDQSPPDANTFGGRLQIALAVSGKKRSQLAEVLRSSTGKMGASVSAVGQVINGKGRMNAENAARAARFLEVNFFWLCVGEGDQADLTLAARELAESFDKIRTVDRRQKAYGSAMNAIEMAVELDEPRRATTQPAASPTQPPPRGQRTPLE